MLQQSERIRIQIFYATTISREIPQIVPKYIYIETMYLHLIFYIL